MNYTAKDLPAWVRFRKRSKPLPLFTVPTRLEWMMAQAINRAAGRLAEIGGHPTWLSGAHGPLRVVLPLDYAKSRLQ